MLLSMRAPGNTKTYLESSINYPFRLYTIREVSELTRISLHWLRINAINKIVFPVRTCNNKTAGRAFYTDSDVIKILDKRYPVFSRHQKKEIVRNLKKNGDKKHVNSESI
jgi:hypothetical protein